MLQRQPKQSMKHVNLWSGLFVPFALDQLDQLGKSKWDNFAKKVGMAGTELKKGTVLAKIGHMVTLDLPQ